ncbi:solute carrier family 22 member 7-like [Lissotriton helveticus]
MKFEELIKDVGGFGKFQIFILLHVAIYRISITVQFVLHNFLVVVPHHSCAVQDGFVNLTEEELLLISIPREADGTLSSCKMYREPQWHLLENSTWNPAKDSTWGPPNNSVWGTVSASFWGTPNASSWGPLNASTRGTLNASTLGPHSTSTWGPPNNSTLQSCQHGWTYDHSQFTSTIATQWDLVCERKWLNQASATFFFIGVTVGSILIGYLSDRYGRRTMLLVTSVFALLSGMAAAASVNYLMFAVFRSLLGLWISGFPMITTALALEWMDVKHRTFAGSLMSMYPSIGLMLLAPVAYLIRDWRWLLFAITSPYIFAIIIIWWLPESPRWLLTKGKVKEAHALLVRCSSVNGRPHLSSNINTEVLSKVAKEENTGANYSFIDLFRNPVLRKVSIGTAVLWFGASFSYYGISFNIRGFELDMYMTQFLYGVIEIPFKLGMYFFMTKWGRRHSLAWALLLTGFCIGINIVIPVSFGVLRTTIAVIGKGFSGAAFTALLLFTVELYPTVLRHNGCGFSSCLGRIGTSMSPLILLLDEVWKPLPQVIYCSVAIVSGLVTFCLHETLNMRLPETVEDTERTR